MEVAEKEKSNVQKPWGHYEVLAEEPGSWKAKRLFIKKGECLSLQSHKKRTEIWYVEKGLGQAYVLSGMPTENNYVDLYPHQIVKIYHGIKHSIEAETDLVIFEIQVGDCDEKDIIRYEDRYGRA